MGQQHPLGIYFAIWGLLFVLSTFSYLVDYFHFVGFQRWALILIFMWLKAGLIVAFFMHMRWSDPVSRLAAVAGIFWLFIMFALTFSDFATRHWLVY